ncbi:MAG TPA: glycosyltransferase family 4 protein [Candidatus Acidoferrales bacterium]|nr:glycosyltransferase family 4 protein [Candidatus Acidoferrales bacterium]
MKVLVLAPPMGTAGGIQQYTATLVAALAKILGEENVRLVAVASQAEARADGSLALRKSVKLLFLTRVLWGAITWRPDLVICTHLGVAPAALKVKSLFHKPYWVVLHGIEVWGNLPPMKLRALREAQRLIANSRFTLDATVSRHNLVGKDSSILPPSFERVQIADNSQKIDIYAGTENIRPTVLTVGRLAASERYKGHDVMLEAWVLVRQKIQNAEYIIVGDGDDRPRLEARAQELGISDSVKFAGAVSGASLQDYYKACSVFALPARTDLDPRAPRGEGFGIVFLEAMSHGKPVVGPMIGAPAEFIHDRLHGMLVDPTKPQEVSAALIELLEHPERAEGMGSAGRDWARQEFSFEKFYERLQGILAMAASSGGR